MTREKVMTVMTVMTVMLRRHQNNNITLNKTVHLYGYGSLLPLAIEHGSITY
jgi:hypothetical protein